MTLSHNFSRIGSIRVGKMSIMKCPLCWFGLRSDYTKGHLRVNKKAKK